MRPASCVRPVAGKPVSAAFRSRAARSFPTSRAFSYSAKAPATCRIMVRSGSSLDVRSTPDAVTTRTPRFCMARTPSFLRQHRACETAGIFDEHKADAIAVNPVEHGGEARAGLDRVRAGHCRVIELADDLQPVRAGVALELPRAGGWSCRRRRWRRSWSEGRRGRVVPYPECRPRGADRQHILGFYVENKSGPESRRLARFLPQVMRRSRGYGMTTSSRHLAPSVSA